MDLPLNSNVNCNQQGPFKILQKILLKVSERIDSRDTQRCPEPSFVIETVRGSIDGSLGKFFQSFLHALSYVFTRTFHMCIAWGGLPNRSYVNN